MSGSPERVCFGEIEGLKDFLSDLDSRDALPPHVIDGQLEEAEGPPFAAIVAEDGDAGFDAHLRDVLFGLLAQSVGDVGSHRFAHVDEDVHRKLFANGTA